MWGCDPVPGKKQGGENQDNWRANTEVLSSWVRDGRESRERKSPLLSICPSRHFEMTEQFNFKINLGIDAIVYFCFSKGNSKIQRVCRKNLPKNASERVTALGSEP